MADRETRSTILAHQEWLGFVQPVGLVVAPAAMAEAGVAPDRNIAARQRDFRELLEERAGSPLSPRWRAPDLRRLFLDWLEWEDEDLVDAAAHRGKLEISLPELDAVLAPTWAAPAEDDPDAEWTMLVRREADGVDLDAPPEDASGWPVSRHARFERLLRETGVSIGLLCTDERIRLVYAPKGESSGHFTFEFAHMAEPAGRPILAAFEMLLSAQALFSGPKNARLPVLLARSRERQAGVSTRLSRQVLAALYELLRGFVAADGRAGGGALGELARDRPGHLYDGLVTALMRLVFVLYAEDRGLMPDHPVYQRHYSVGGLFAGLREDAAAWPDTMDQRFGAWARLLALFRLIHGGGGHGDLSFVAREGALFDPGRYPFLEGRGAEGGARALPTISDGTVLKLLESLVVLDGERLSYRALDVEQIGSVYEAAMGFRVEIAAGRSIAVRSAKRTGASVAIDLDALLALDGGKRAKALQELADRKLSPGQATALRAARTAEDVVAALDRLIDRDATPEPVPAGAPILQPTDERRRSGSHYTPRALTEPIVREALRPVLERLGARPRPEAILDLKVLDPAMGSGAFLVEACRQLADRLVEAWGAHGGPPDIPADEDEALHARRLVARRCLYGVDRNPMAAELGRLSLWLATLARDHEFTFLDHALKSGDSLVGLDRRRIGALQWSGSAGSAEAMALFGGLVEERVAEALAGRAEIRDAPDDVARAIQEARHAQVEKRLDRARALGDAVVSAFFAADKPAARERRRSEIESALLGRNWDPVFDAARALRAGAQPVVPLHWEIEFPEVFERDNPGFDAIVGNPPFAGKNTIIGANAKHYPDWLKTVHAESHGNADLAAHFFRRAFGLLREGGALGLVATNTIAQGDTRSTGLRWICENGGAIYRARRRIEWPGEAAVVVTTLHILKGDYEELSSLDGRETARITAFLFDRGGHDDPARLAENQGKSFQGSILLGMGFTFDDTDKKGIASPIAEMERSIAEDPRNSEVIFPYIGGKEVNAHPAHKHHRYAIDFKDWPLCRAELGALWRDADHGRRREWLREGVVPLDYPEPVAADWPELLAIVEESVKPGRAHLTDNAIGRKRAKFWWLYGSVAKELYDEIETSNKVLVISRVGQHAALAFLSTGMIYADSIIVFPFESHAAFCALQSRPHEIWVRFFGSSMKDDLRYTPSDCFETFPFPKGWETDPALEAVGTAYYEFRAALMVERNKGLTDTYGRFHDPGECRQEIARLRELHAAMDRAVLDAYGWTDIPNDCEFLLDYEIDDETWGRRKKPWRYRWPDEVRDEVLARLLALNAERAALEADGKRR